MGQIFNGRGQVKSDFARIHFGMSEDEVREILGQPESISAFDIRAYRLTTWIYVRGDKLGFVWFGKDRKVRGRASE